MRFFVRFQNSDLLLFIHDVEYALTVEQKVDMCSTQRVDTLDKAVSTHLDKWVCAHHFNLVSLRVLDHEENGTFVIHNHGLANHLSALEELNILELNFAVSLLKIGISCTPVFFNVLVCWERETKRKLIH